MPTGNCNERSEWVPASLLSRCHHSQVVNNGFLSSSTNTERLDEGGRRQALTVRPASILLSVANFKNNLSHNQTEVSITARRRQKFLQREMSSIFHVLYHLHSPCCSQITQTWPVLLNPIQFVSNFKFIRFLIYSKRGNVSEAPKIDIDPQTGHYSVLHAKTVNVVCSVRKKTICMIFDITEV